MFAMAATDGAGLSAEAASDGSRGDNRRQRRRAIPGPSTAMRNVAIFMLAFQQFLALTLIASVIPVVLRAEGVSLDLIGLFSAAMFAFTVNFLWAPVVDRYSLGPLGLRRSWLLATQVASALVVAAMALLDPARDEVPLFVAGIALALVIATQRIATLGYAADVLAPAERGFGTALMGCGGAISNAVGAAACLALVSAIGWQLAILGFAAFLGALAFTVMGIPEPPRAPISQVVKASGHVMLGTARLWGVAGLLAPAAFGIAIAYAMALPRLVDAGIPLVDVGWIGGLANMAAFLAFAPLAGWAVTLTAPERAVKVTATVLAAALLLVTTVSTGLSAGHAAIVTLPAVFAAIAVQHVAFSTWLLALARRGHEASDVTFLMAVLSAVALAGFAASGRVAESFGYHATLLCAVAGYGISAILLLVARRRRGHVIRPALGP
jgi:MFS family permease